MKRGEGGRAGTSRGRIPSPPSGWRLLSAVHSEGVNWGCAGRRSSFGRAGGWVGGHAAREGGWVHTYVQQGGSISMPLDVPVHNRLASTVSARGPPFVICMGAPRRTQTVQRYRQPIPSWGRAGSVRWNRDTAVRDVTRRTCTPARRNAFLTMAIMSVPGQA